MREFPDVTVLRPADFHPSTAAERKGAYAIHHRARSWKDAEGWRQVAIEAERQLEQERGRHRKTRKAHARLRKEFDQLQARLAQMEKDQASPVEAGTTD